MAKMYFGHPVNTYGTEQESELVEKIKKVFPGHEVENPNQPHHEEGYQARKSRGERGRDYYFKDVLPNMDAGTFLPFEDDMLGAGVYGEAEFLADAGKPIYEISIGGVITRLELDESRRLSVEETRKRIRG
ncbi:hypothetical protein HOD53_03380 [Candidatus Woesearchaeota archaeon]|nr:hypothetical protein [Candidatus Woesearchaeota archaeon]